MPTQRACALATEAAAALAGDVVGVDLLPLANGDYVVLEVNGAVDFTTESSLVGRDVFDEVAGIVTLDATALDVSGKAFG
jgi:glutathione synthase/RimK-type ligase-like ATP-grasp enzyme